MQPIDLLSEVRSAYEASNSLDQFLRSLSYVRDRALKQGALVLVEPEDRGTLPVKVALILGASLVSLPPIVSTHVVDVLDVIAQVFDEELNDVVP